MYKQLARVACGFALSSCTEAPLPAATLRRAFKFESKGARQPPVVELAKTVSLSKTIGGDLRCELERDSARNVVGHIHRRRGRLREMCQRKRVGRLSGTFC